jgi:hypothetical protein
VGLWPIGWLLTGLLSGCGEVSVPRETLPAGTAPVVVPTSYPVAGSPSCSGKSCHGGAVPADPDKAPAWPSSFSVWQESDPHTQAHQVLSGTLARQMGQALGIKNVAEHPACLACHTNPRASSAAVVGTDWARQEWLFGVGCESCHGSARDWLVPHRATDWKKKSPADKAKAGMNPLEDLPVRAEVCVGCHVGAPADPENGIPARDVNHDFIAAGHPRLMFEFGSYQAHLSKHWKEKGDNAKPTFEARSWLIGQPVSARAALDLLVKHRTGAGQVWPELAEFDCYACHQPLRNESWKNKQKRPRGTMGNLQPADWYTGLLPVVSRWAKVNPPVKLEAVRYLLGIEGLPTEKELDSARNKALADRGTLSALLKALQTVALTQEDCARLRVELAKYGAGLEYADWDQIEQVMLGLVAVHTAEIAPRDPKVPLTGRAKEIDEAIKKLAKKLAFPSDANSPKTFRRATKLDEERKTLLETLAKP